jgi:hypothetical protein
VLENARLLGPLVVCAADFAGISLAPTGSNASATALHCERHEPPVARFDQIEGIKGLADQRGDPEG